MKNTINSLAFLDSFSGLIPCKVIKIDDFFANNPALAGRSSSCLITVQLTEKRGAYKKGEVHTGNALNIVPRNHIRYSNGIPRIVGGYVWEN